MNFNTIDKFDLKNKKILVRADLNVPLDSKGNVLDNTRIKASLPLIKKILSQGGILMLTSHLGRPKEGKLKKNESLLSLVGEFSKLVNVEVKYYGFFTLVFFLFYKEPEKSNLFQILKKMDEKILNSRYFKFLAWSVLIKAKKS